MVLEIISIENTVPSTYGELSNLNGLVNRMKDTRLFVHFQNKGHACRRFPITVDPVILFRNSK